MGVAALSLGNLDCARLSLNSVCTFWADKTARSDLRLKSPLSVICAKKLTASATTTGAESFNAYEKQIFSQIKDRI